jgi:hypothetical protein
MKRGDSRPDRDPTALQKPDADQLDHSALYGVALVDLAGNVGGSSGTWDAPPRQD